MTESISQLTVLHYELRHGSVANVPRHLTHSISPDLQRAMDTAHHSRRTVAIDSTPFEVFSDFTCTSEGNGAYYIIANCPLGGGRVQPGTELYFGVSATRLSTSPTAWRHVLRNYVSSAGSGRPGVMFSSYGTMPRQLPWTAGYLTQDANALNRGERDFVVTIARLAAVRLVALGERDSRAAENEGRDFTPDPANYPELL